MLGSSITIGCGNLLQMYKARRRFKEARVGNRTWEDACFRVPIVNPDIDASDFFGWSKRKRRRKGCLFHFSIFVP